MLFVGCLMLGLGLGLLFDQVPAGALIGMGIGFILSGIFERLDPWLRHGPGRRARDHGKV